MAAVKPMELDLSAKALPWREHGACRGSSPELFFPPEEDEGSAAKAVCNACVVRTTCLEFAIATRERDGVWGGLTAVERRRLIRRRRRQNTARRSSAA
jgi:WhiB family redox-sensing transcriptional regulator